MKVKKIILFVLYTILTSQFSSACESVVEKLQFTEDRRYADIFDYPYVRLTPPDPFQSWNENVGIDHVITPGGIHIGMGANGFYFPYDDGTADLAQEYMYFDMTVMLTQTTEIVISGNLDGYLEYNDAGWSIWSSFAVFRSDNATSSNNLYAVYGDEWSDPDGIIDYTAVLSPGEYRIQANVSAESGYANILADITFVPVQITTVDNVTLKLQNQQPPLEGDADGALMNVTAALDIPPAPTNAAPVFVFLGFDPNQVSLTPTVASSQIHTNTAGLLFIEFEYEHGGTQFTSTTLRVTAVDDMLHEGLHSTPLDLSVFQSTNSGTYTMYLRDNDGPSTNGVYNTWANTMGLTNLISDCFCGDPNGDGVLNIGHFAFGSDPLGETHSSQRSLQVIDFPGGSNVVQFCTTVPVRNGAVFGGTPLSATIDGLTYTMMGMGNLTTSSPLSVAEYTPAITNNLPDLNAGWSYRSFYIDSPIDADAQAFIKLEASAEQ